MLHIDNCNIIIIIIMECIVFVKLKHCNHRRKKIL